MGFRSVAILLIATLLTIGCSHAPPSTGETGNPQEVSKRSIERGTRFSAAEFRTGKDGRPLLVSVDWNGDPLIFLLDTGASKTVFDSSLRSRLGDLISRATLKTSAGLVAAEEFACPNATVGRL